MTKEVKIGELKIGGGAPITVQSMTNTKTDNIEATIAQILRLQDAGADIVRLSVNNNAAAAAISEIKKSVHIPLVADIHFDYKLAIKSIENGIDKVRINPSNIGSERAVKSVVDAAKMHHVSIRVGVNGGSLEKDLLNKYGMTGKSLAESALNNVKQLEKFSFTDIVISAKCSDVKTNVEAYDILSKSVNYPLHIGVTEAGGGEMALAKSYAGIGSLLLNGIGDTLRFSITGDPVEEVKAGINLLKALDLRDNYVNVIACPTCARTEINVLELFNKVKLATENIRKKYTVAVMGCVVNGIGEGAHADVGVAGGKEKSVIFKHGMILKEVNNADIWVELMKIIEEDIGD